MENHRLYIGTYYNVPDNYDDFNDWSNVDITNESVQGSTYAYGAPQHASVATAFHILRLRNYYRHIKSHGFKRAPWCDDVTESYFNLSLHTTDGACDNLQPPNSPIPHLQVITETAQQHGIGLGLYFRAMEDFFYEVDFKTGQVGPNGKLTSSYCLCRRFLDPLDNPDYWLDPPLLNSNGFDTWATDTDFAFWQIQTQHQSHYLCVNCTDWRNLLSQRLSVLASHGIHAMFFDVRYTPERGCWCGSCRARYAALFGEPYLGLEFEPQTPLSGLSPGNYRTDRDFEVKHAMSRWTNRSLVEHFGALNDAMHPFGTASIVSVQDMPALNTDDHNTEFAATVDVPKTEWYMTLKGSNNDIFWGAGSNSLLSNYHVPEYIRIAAGIGVIRDVSKFRLPFVWIGDNELFYPMLPSAPGGYSNSVVNNKRLRTLLGFGSVLGAITSTNLSSSFYLDGTDGTMGFSRSVWSFVNDINVHNTVSYEGQNLHNLPNPYANEITHIFDLDHKFGALLANKRPYDWVSILFSEEERNRYLYDEGSYNNTNNAAYVTSLQLNERDSWNNMLFAFYGGFHALYNGLTSDPNGSVKMPVTFVTGNYPLKNKQFAPRSVWVPYPMASTLSSNGQISTPDFNLTKATNNLIGEVSQSSIPCYAIQSQADWFRNGVDQTSLQQSFRNQVISQSGMPGVYVIGSTPKAKHVLASFFVPTLPLPTQVNQNPVIESRDIVTVPLVADPMWSIPRWHYTFNNTSNSWEETFTDIEPGITYDAANQTIENNALEVHIPVLGQLKPDEGCQLVARFYNSDPQLSELNLPISVIATSSGDEYVIQVPSFSHYAIINISQVCIE